MNVNEPGNLPKPEPAVTARKWLLQALHDLEMADKNIGIGGYDVASFLAHQAIEKLLKALIAQSGRDIPKTHYLDRLAREVRVPRDASKLLNALAGEYMLSRYPDMSDKVPYEEYDRAIANENVRAARKLFEFLKSRYSRLLR